MVRLLVFALLPLTALADGGQNQRLRIGIELTATHYDAAQSWLDEGTSKFASTENGLQAQSLFIDFDRRLADPLTFHFVAEGYDDNAGRGLDVTEAFFRWRPLPLNGYRLQVRAGAFYPRLSLENTADGWRSEFTDSFSAINTWIGEELRTFGAEFDLTRRFRVAGQATDAGVFGSIFYANDPADSLLGWRGWALHARQTRLDDALPLAALPTFVPGAEFEAQADYVRPFRETDDSPGFTAGVRVRVGAQLVLEAAHYDNRADPLALENGHYGWGTRFNHVGLRARLPAAVTLVSQWMDGTSVMGPYTNGWHAVDTAFESYFVLLSRDFGRTQLSARYDTFDVEDRDRTPMDSNSEDGTSLTVSVRYNFSRDISISGEWQQVESERAARNYFGVLAAQDETRLSLTLRALFSL